MKIGFKNPDWEKQVNQNKVNNPSHYKGKSLEAINVIEDFDLNYNLGNAIKYILRAGKKENSSKKEDLEKAMWYLKRELLIAKWSLEEGGFMEFKDFDALREFLYKQNSIKKEMQC
jgi:hypothetical protein